MMEWEKGEILGQGSFSSVYLATPRRNSHSFFPPLMAVKSSLVSQSSLLKKEKEILTQLRDCPQILNCFGDDLTTEKNGNEFYNLFLEFASGGNLSQFLKKSGGSIPESHVQFFTRSILLGLSKIHEKGFVHCDIKLQNILLCSSDHGLTEVKIADFGLAKKTEEMKNQRNSDEELFDLRGTPLYMAPESVSSSEFEPVSDIWALGCLITEMITGNPAWKFQKNSDISSLLYRIGFKDELPLIPDELSEEGKDFLRRCFVRDPRKRWTAKMLLDHPFVLNSTVSLPINVNEESPRTAFDFPEWSSEKSSISSSIESSSHPILNFEDEFDRSEFSVSPLDRIRQLAVKNDPNWSGSDSWITVRNTESPLS